MNNTVSGILGFVIGAIASGVAVYIYQDKRLSKKFEEELKICEARYKAKADGVEYVPEDADSESKGDDTDDDKLPFDENADKNAVNIPQSAIDAAKAMQDGVKKAREEREAKRNNKTNYSSLTRGHANVERTDGMKDKKEETLSEKIINNKPYYIDCEEFQEMDGKDGYRGVDLFYNADDCSVCNDDGEVLEDAHIMIGWDIMQDLYDTREKELYVRNDNLKEVYCIMMNFMIK